MQGFSRICVKKPVSVRARRCGTSGGQTPGGTLQNEPADIGIL
jgi:hypothetical protein